MGASSSTEGPVPRAAHEKQIRDLHDRFHRRQREIESTWSARYEQLTTDYGMFRYGTGLGLALLGGLYLGLARVGRGGTVSKQAFEQLKDEAMHVTRRAKLDVEQAQKYGCKSLAMNLLDVSDNLDRALNSKHVNSEESMESLLEGLAMTKSELEKAFGSAGIEKIEPLGEPFNPAIHEALAETDPSTNEYPFQHVSDVIQTGFKLHDHILRPARVFVNKSECDDEGKRS